MFGFLELEDDPEVMRALLDAAAAWLRERGRDRMVGPMDFTMNDESGVLIEGFEREPMIRQAWHPPYYQRLCEEAGLEKAVDMFMWELHITGRDKVMPIIWELAEKLEPKHGIRIRKMSRLQPARATSTPSRRSTTRRGRATAGFVPYSKEDLDAYAQELQLVFDRDWFMIAEDARREDRGHGDHGPGHQPGAEEDERAAAAARLVALPAPAAGSIDRCRVGFLGVKPAYQHTGVAAGLYAEHFDMAEATRVKWGEMGWILETNKAMNRAMKAMGGEIVKKYRVYERTL